ncbi:phosphoribosylformimino-5-aminoimidazole carboxamide ribotide isomerase [Thermodesulfobacteriota bacterium]
MKFRPCIDLHNGEVKQIVGGTLSDQSSENPQTNFVSDQASSYYAALYREDGLTGGHVIKLGPGNDAAAIDALSAYPGGLHIGGGITAANASGWLDSGASAVIVTSYVFQDGVVREDRILELVEAVGKERIVLDLSCRKRGDEYLVVTDRWQKFTDVRINQESLDYFSQYCAEFLIHAVDMEGKCAGIDARLVTDLGRWVSIPTTYAGGVKSMGDLVRIKELGGDRIDATIGSALDIFGGKGVLYREAVDFNNLSS